jgi:hypothetical protein
MIDQRQSLVAVASSVIADVQFELYLIVQSPAALASLTLHDWNTCTAAMRPVKLHVASAAYSSIAMYVADPIQLHSAVTSRTNSLISQEL